MHVVQVLRLVFASPDVRRVQGGWLVAITAEWIWCRRPSSPQNLDAADAMVGTRLQALNDD